MASFFGEVTALSSRAVDEEDCESESRYVLNFDFIETPKAQPTPYDIVVFSVGEIASAFVMNYFLSEGTQPLAIVRCPGLKEYDEDVAIMTGFKHFSKSNEMKLASVYSCKDNIVFCDILDSAPEEVNIDLCSKILKTFPSSQALIFTTYHMASYKSKIQAEKPFLRALATSKYMESQSCTIPLLPLPNIVSKFPSAVMTEFEVTGKPAVTIINYVDTLSLDSLNVEIFEGSLEENLIVRNIPVNSDAKTRLRKYLKAKQGNDSNLYI